jgi:hypothetical protein
LSDIFQNVETEKKKIYICSHPKYEVDPSCPCRVANSCKGEQGNSNLSFKEAKQEKSFAPKPAESMEEIMKKISFGHKIQYEKQRK